MEIRTPDPTFIAQEVDRILTALPVHPALAAQAGRLAAAALPVLWLPDRDVWSAAGVTCSIKGRTCDACAAGQRVPVEPLPARPWEDDAYIAEQTGGGPLCPHRLAAMIVAKYQKQPAPVLPPWETLVRGLLTYAPGKVTFFLLDEYRGARELRRAEIMRYRLHGQPETTLPRALPIHLWDFRKLIFDLGWQVETTAGSPTVRDLWLHNYIVAPLPLPAAQERFRTQEAVPGQEARVGAAV